MNFRVDRRVTADGHVVLSLSGRITARSLGVLQGLFEREGGPVTLDLKGVLLVDSDAVRFLALREGNGIELRNCPAYVREWITRERAQMKPGPSEPGER